VYCLRATFQALPGSSFTVNGAAPPQDSLLASAGFEIKMASGVTFLTKFDGEFGAKSATYGGTGTLTMFSPFGTAPLYG